jgi:2-dehydropantoate 2-reductase
MRFDVVGAGAIGGVTGAHLVRDGEEVRFIDAAPAHVAAMNENGLFIDGVTGEFRVPARACLPEGVDGPLDVVLLAVKSQHTMAALDLIEPHLDERSLVVSLQNSLNPDRIAARIGAHRVIGGFINFAADYIGPGHVRYGGVGDYFLGGITEPVDERLPEIAEKFGRIMNAVMTDNIMGYLWSKEVYGSLLIGTALVDAPVHEVLARRESRDALAAAMREAMAVADAEGVALEYFEPFDPALLRSGDPRDIETMLDDVATRFENRVKQHTGIWRDLRVRKRKTEVEWLTGEVVRRGRERGLDMSVNARLVEMIAEIERGERDMVWENLVELHSLLPR